MHLSRRSFTVQDFKKISQFYLSLSLSGQSPNFLKCMWECFSIHPCFPDFHPEKIGIWECSDRIVGIVCSESPWYGTVYIDAFPEYSHLYPEMIRYAEKHFARKSNPNNYILQIRTLQDTHELHQYLNAAGYTCEESDYIFTYPLQNTSIPAISIPPGYQIKLLSEIYDFASLNELIWNAFRYDGDPPAYNAENIQLSHKHAWMNYKKEICTVVLAPDGSYASFCGMWFDEDTHNVFLEPLVTSEKHRKLGLAKAAIYHSLNICLNMGADALYVEPDDAASSFYVQAGFQQHARPELIWEKTYS